MQGKRNAMGQAFDTSKNDDSFYLPPEVFDNPDFKRGMNMFISPDGKAVRFIISHLGDPATAEGIAHVDAIRNATFEAIKGPAGKRPHLHRRHRRHRQRHERGSHLRPVDPRSGSTDSDLCRHAGLDPRGHRRRGHRRHRAAVPGVHRSAFRCSSGSTSWASNCTG